MTVTQALFISFVILLLSGFFIYFTIVLNRRILKHKKDISSIVEEKDKQLLKATIETQEVERNRIGSNIHDDIGPLLSILKLKVNKVFDTYSNINNHDVKAINELVDHLVVQVQKISKELVPSVLYQLGIETALHYIFTKMQEISDAKVEEEIDVDFDLISKTHAITIYRIIQESFNNILKHTDATYIRLVLKSVDNHYILKIEDDGDGFDFEDTNGGLGLKNMNARVRALNGEFTITSEDNQGTKIAIKIPMHESEENKNRDN